MIRYYIYDKSADPKSPVIKAIAFSEEAAMHAVEWVLNEEARNDCENLFIIPIQE